jgi:hypothetical protein
MVTTPCAAFARGVAEHAHFLADAVTTPMPIAGASRDHLSYRSLLLG